jgi:predicted transcriptional regulator
MVSMNKYRSRIQIVRDILFVTASRTISRKTHIMYGANLSYKLVTQYLDEVVNAGLLQCDNGGFFTLTFRGKEFLKLCENYEKNSKVLEGQLNHLKDDEQALHKMLSL